MECKITQNYQSTTNIVSDVLKKMKFEFEKYFNFIFTKI